MYTYIRQQHSLQYLKLRTTTNMADISVTVDQVQDMDFNELCEFLENMEVDYSALENIEDLRDLLIQSITGQNSFNNPSQTQNQVH